MRSLMNPSLNKITYNLSQAFIKLFELVQHLLVNCNQMKGARSDHIFALL